MLPVRNQISSPPNFTQNLRQLKKCLLLAALLPATSSLFAQNGNPVGTISIGTRNTVSVFSDDGALGKGIGGQTRVRLGKKLNSEWFPDYITSKKTDTYRNDYHIGWSLMFYPGRDACDDRVIQPYLLAGHCFDKSKVSAKSDQSISASRLSMAMQAGLGSHFNITSRFDISVSGQYMLHFGKDIEVRNDEETGLVIQKANYSTVDGHMLFTVSINFKILNL
jgi:hypothetical protein